MFQTSSLSVDAVATEPRGTCFSLSPKNHTFHLRPWAKSAKFCSPRSLSGQLFLHLSMSHARAFIFLAATLLSSFAHAAGTLKLFLKDGTYQLAREYKVQADRVRYYSTERGEWEELPLAL